jgi:hypothetical protein
MSAQISRIDALSNGSPESLGNLIHVALHPLSIECLPQRLHRILVVAPCQRFAHDLRGDPGRYAQANHIAGGHHRFSSQGMQPVFAHLL